MASKVRVSPDQALAELVSRELAKRQLAEFCEYVAPWYHAYRHHRLIAWHLQQVTLYVQSAGQAGIGRLLICVPPRHGKSELASRMFPAWFLGKLPDSRVILVSYGADLATANSRAVREHVDSQRYHNVFSQVTLSSDSRSVEAWDLAAPNRGGVIAAGIGGGITGKGAHLLVVDDPFKNRDEADSASYRQRVWDWWTSSAYTRLEKGGAVVGMLTRWHPDDWAGRLLKMMSEARATGGLADHWTVVWLPGVWERPEPPAGMTFNEFAHARLAEGVYVQEYDLLERQPGEALWSEKYSVDDLAKLRSNVGDYDFTALYQQMPYSRLGSLFQEEWFTVVDMPPKPEEVVSRVRSWDKAGNKSGSGGDFATGVLLSLTRDGMIYVEHIARGQWTPGKREEEMLETARIDARRPGPATVVWHQQDPGSAGLDSAQMTSRKLAAEGFTAHFEPVSGDKVTRAGPWSTACQSGQVRLVRGGWNRAFIDEHVAFPRGNFDDQVDASSEGYRRLMSEKGWFGQIGEWMRMRTVQNAQEAVNNERLLV